DGLEGHHDRIVDHHVDPAPAADGRPHGGLHLLRARHVGPGEDGLAAALGDLPHRAAAAVLVEVDHHDAPALGAEAQAGGPADPPAPAGHQADFVLEAHRSPSERVAWG